MIFWVGKSCVSKFLADKGQYAINMTFIINNDQNIFTTQVQKLVMDHCILNF